MRGRRLDDASAFNVVNEAMLTINMDKAKAKGQIIAEVQRVLRLGGRYAIHELALTPDERSDEIATQVRQSLARSIKVNAHPAHHRPVECLDRQSPVRVDNVDTAEMALLTVRRVIADVEIVGTLRIGWNYLRDADVRKRVTGMWQTFQK